MCGQIIVKKVKLKEPNRISLWTIQSCLAIVSGHCHRKPTHSGDPSVGVPLRRAVAAMECVLCWKQKMLNPYGCSVAGDQSCSPSTGCSSTSKSRCENDSNLCLQNVQNTCARTSFKAWLIWWKLGSSHLFFNKRPLLQSAVACWDNAIEQGTHQHVSWEKVSWRIVSFLQSHFS